MWELLELFQTPQVASFNGDPASAIVRLDEQAPRSSLPTLDRVYALSGIHDRYPNAALSDETESPRRKQPPVECSEASQEGCTCLFAIRSLKTDELDIANRERARQCRINGNVREFVHLHRRNLFFVSFLTLSLVLHVANHLLLVLGAEEQPGGLLIVRGARASPPPSSQPTPGPSAPPTTSKPPSKKFRAGSSQPPAHAISSQRADDSLLDPQIENDVRAMEDEADSLRRNSRAPTSLDYSSGHANGLTFTASKTSINPGFQFPAAKPTNGKSTGKAKANHGQETTIDMIVPLPADDTPQIVRNKRLRASAMAQFDQPAANPPVDSTSGESRKHRRRSSVGRGKRISSSFASTGVICAAFFFTCRLHSVLTVDIYQPTPITRCLTRHFTNT